LSSETALTALTKLKIKRLLRQKGERATSLLHWQNDPDSLLTTILIGNNLVNIAASSKATALAISIGIRHGVTVVIIVMTALILVFGEVDKILGILYVKDLLFLNGTPPRTLQEVMRPAIFVLETKSISALFKLFREEHIHIAIIVDEYGGVSGLITLEDLLEEIVGQISDEYDNERRDIERLENSDLLVSARIRLKSIERILNVTLPGNRNANLNTVILEQLGYVPQEGDQIAFGPVVFIVSKVESNRIKNVRVRTGLLS
jgi:CBS domain containing-hemolysin-like protein